MTERSWTAAMGEISGFGGGYENCCRAMISAGMDWCDAHPRAKPKFSTFKNLFGAMRCDNEEAKSLTEAMVEAARACGGATAIMYETCVSHVQYYAAHGWDAYVKYMCARELADRLKRREKSDAN